ncbi:MAG: hypothetical protein WC492_00625 [Candidatus Micrarchaeia archaeon]
MRAILYLVCIALIFSGVAFSQVVSDPNTDISMSYGRGSLDISRNLQITPAGMISSTTGAAVPIYQSKVIIRIVNNANTPKTNMSITEDISYVPPNAKITYSTMPTKQDGTYSSWDIGTLQPNQMYEISFSAPAIISKAGFEVLPAPSISYDRQKAVFNGPKLVQVQKTILLEVFDKAGKPISGATISVTSPDSKVSVVNTDEKGQARVLAQQTGFYQYEVSDYDAGKLQSTQVVAQLAEQGQNEPAVVPTQPVQTKPSQTTQTEPDIFAMVFAILPMLLVVFVVIAIVYAIYKYFNTPIDDGNDEPIPPAPATRPSISGEGNKSLQEEGEWKRADTISTKDEIEDDAQIVNATQDMISRRKGMSPISDEREKEQMQEEEKKASDEADEKEKNEEQEDEDDSGEEKSSDDKEDEEISDIEGIGSGEPDTVLGKQESSDEEHIDDDAIKKTIAELEQLREQLRSNIQGQPEREEESVQEEEKPKAKKPAHQLSGIVEQGRKMQKENLIKEDIGKLLQETGQIKKPAQVQPKVLKKTAPVIKPIKKKPLKLAAKKPAKAQKKTGKKASVKKIKPAKKKKK